MQETRMGLFLPATFNRDYGCPLNLLSIRYSEKNNRFAHSPIRHVTPEEPLAL